jgi:hypothetical protein
MDLVHEQHVPAPEGRQQPDQVASPLEHRSAAGADADTHLAGDERREGCLPESWRAEEQGVIERFTTLPGGIDGNLQILADSQLTDELREPCRSQRDVVRRLVREGLGCGDLGPRHFLAVASHRTGRGPWRRTCLAWQVTHRSCASVSSLPTSRRLVAPHFVQFHSAVLMVAVIWLSLRVVARRG